MITTLDGDNAKDMIAGFNPTFQMKSKNHLIRKVDLKYLRMSFSQFKVFFESVTNELSHQITNREMCSSDFEGTTSPLEEGKNDDHNLSVKLRNNYNIDDVVVQQEVYNDDDDVYVNIGSNAQLFVKSRPVRVVNMATMVHPFDKNGLLYHLATKGGTEGYINPHQAGRVKVRKVGLNMLFLVSCC